MELVFLRENGDIPDVFNITFKETTVWNYSIIKVIRFFISNFYNIICMLLQMGHDNGKIFKTEYNFFTP